MIDLQARFDAAPDAASALALQRDIERVKFETELSLLRIQASHARRIGRIDSAEEIESAIQSALDARASEARPRHGAAGATQR